MAIDYAAISGVANRIFAEPLQDYVNRANPILQAITKRAVASDRIYMKGILSSSHAAGAIADGSTVTLAGTEGTQYTAPTLDWSTYVSKFAVNKRAAEQMANQPGGLGNLLQSEVMMAAKDLADKIAADLFGGSVSNGLVGVQSMINNTGIYGGVNRDTSGNEAFRSVVLDVKDTDDATVELSTNALYEADSLFFEANGYGFTETPGLFTGVTDRKIMTKYKQLMENIDLSAMSAAHFVNRANSTGSLGYGSVGFAGVPFIRDRNISAAGDIADSGRLYILDMSKIELAVLVPNPNMSLIHQVQGYSQAPVVDGIRTTIEFLGNTGEQLQGYVKAYVQLASPNPKAAGMVIKNIKAN